MSNTSSGIPLIIYEGLKKIKEICDPEMFPPLFESINNSINNLQKMIDDNNFKHYKIEAKPFFDAFALIVNSSRSLAQRQALSTSDIKLFDSFQRITFNTFYLIFSQSSADNYPKRKLTSFIIKTIILAQFDISLNPNLPTSANSDNEDFEFLVAKVCHACFNSISGALYVHGSGVRKLLELMYRSFSYSKKQEIQEKIQSLIEDVIILLFNRYCEPEALPQVLDENFESFTHQIAQNLISNSLIIRYFSDNLLPPHTYSTRIAEIDLYVLISFFCRASEIIFYNFYPMAFAVHYLLTALSVKSNFFNSVIFKILLKKYISQTVTYSFLNRHDLFTRPSIDLLLTVYRLFPDNFTGSFQTILMDGLYTALNSPSQRAKMKAMTIFSSILSEKHFFPDIFANLDGGKYYSSVFRDLTEIIVENCYPKQKYRQISTEIIKNILEMMIGFLSEMPQLKIKDKEKQDYINHNSDIDSNYNLKELALFNSYNLLMKGVSIFKNSPEKGVKYFIDNKIIEESNPESVSNFLFNCKKLDKYQIAMFLTENLNFEYLNFFMKNYSFKTIKYFDEALRIFLSHLTLPKDETRADILLTIFGNQYIHTKGRIEFSSSDAVVSFTKKLLSFQSYEQRLPVLQEKGLSSIISISEKGTSLSTSRREILFKSSSNQVPPFDKFIEIMNGINDGGNLSTEFLKSIYFNISVAPIILSPLERETTEQNRMNRNNRSTTNINTSNENLQNSSTATTLNLNQNSSTATTSTNSIKKLQESEESPSIQVNYSHNENSLDESQTNQNQNQNQNQNENETETMNSTFLLSLSFVDPEILIKPDRNIEWYLCKCNQTSYISRIQKVHEEQFYHCKTSFVIRPMFESVWGSIHGSIVANIEASTDEEEASEHIDNLQLCIKIAARSRAEESLTILMTSLATFSGLLNPVYRTNLNNQNQGQNFNWKLNKKNVACFIKMLIIAIEDADFLSPVWHILVDQLSLVDLYKPKELVDSEVTDFVDKFFNSSSKFQLNSVIALINAMIKVCNKELSEKPERRLYMIQKLVLVAQYNMKRKNKEWSQIWEIIGNNYLSFIIAFADSKNDLILSKKVIDYIRYLTSFFLQVDENPRANYQYNFMMTFLIVFQEQCTERSQIYLLEAISTIIKEQSISLRSGWAMIFEILTLATAEIHTQEIAFKILSDLVNNQIVIENPAYAVHLIAFIATYSRNANSAAPIPFYDKICDKLALNPNTDNIKDIQNMWIELFQSISRSSRCARIEIRKATNDSYLNCLIILAEKYNLIMSSNAFDQEIFPPMINSIWEFAITNTFEEMSFAELDKFLIKYDEKFIHRYIDLLGDNAKHIINILILSVFKDGSESGRINKNSNTNINADVAIQILLNLVSQKIDQSTKDFVISLLTQTVQKVPTLSIDHARSYVYLLNQFSKLFKDSKKDEFIQIFTNIGNAMINSSNSDAIKRNVVCALARESLLVELQDCDNDILDETQKAKMINETFVIYLNSGFTQSAESLAGAEWMRVICLSLNMVNSIEDDERFSAYFDVMVESLLAMIESSSKEIRSQLGTAVERKLLL